MNDMLAQQYEYNATSGAAAQIASMLGKVMAGQTEALSRYGYKFNEAQKQVLKFGTEEQRAAVLAEVVEQSVGGMNAEMARTPVGHCTSHTTTFSTDTSEVKVKPPKNMAASVASKFKSKRVTGLAVQVKVEGLQFHSETEAGFKELLGRWKLGASVELVLFERENDEQPYCSGNFIITTLENTAPAGEDATYSATFDNDGPVSIDETKVDLLAQEG